MTAVTPMPGLPDRPGQGIPNGTTRDGRGSSQRWPPDSASCRRCVRWSMPRVPRSSPTRSSSPGPTVVPGRRHHCGRRPGGNSSTSATNGHGLRRWTSWHEGRIRGALRTRLRFGDRGDGGGVARRASRPAGREPAPVPGAPLGCRPSTRGAGRSGRSGGGPPHRLAGGRPTCRSGGRRDAEALRPDGNLGVHRQDRGHCHLDRDAAGHHGRVSRPDPGRHGNGPARSPSHPRRHHPAGVSHRCRYASS